MFFIYVIRLRSGIYYKGLTNDVNRRLDQHSLGQVKSTRSQLPFKLIHVEVVPKREDARRIEKYFKSGYGREIIEELDC